MENTTVAILGSNILGPHALLDQGFDWVEKPDAAKLAVAIAKLHSIEQGWEARIRKWKTEGALGDEPIEMSPGALIWLVSIDSAEFARSNHHALGKIAKMIGSREPHAKLIFESDNFGVNAIASELFETLRRCSPILYGTARGKSSAKVAEVKPRHQVIAAGEALLPA